jgi:hypothetical protein
MLLTFDKVARPVRLEGVDSAPPAFVSVFRFWPWWSMPDDAAADPLIRITPDGNAFWLEAPWLAERLRYNDAVNLACGLAVHVNHAMLMDRPDLLCLHGAGIEIDGRLVVFPNAYRAGKSLLTACLAAAGARVFSDDILPIDRNSRQGVAIGVSPRLRLPLPETTGERSKRFIEARSGATNTQYLYVELDERRQVSFGEQSPFAGFVLLERRDGSPAVLEPVSDGETLKQLVLRNFARQIPAADSLDFLHGLVATAACYKLTYSVGDEAADVLMTRFTDHVALARDVEAKAATDMLARPTDVRPVAGGDHIRRSPGIGERLVGDGLFLTDQTGESVYHLNLVGAAVWRLLDGECSLGEAKALIHQAFPDVTANQIDRDTDRLVQDLVDQGLLIQPENVAFA